MSSVGNCTVLGDARQLSALINREQLQQIIIADAAATERDFENYRKVARQMGVTISRPLDYHTTVKHTVAFGLPLLEVRPRTADRGQQFLKRMLDILIAATALVVLAPVLILCMILIKSTSEGPIFYKSTRVGKGGRYFTFWKFRSMYYGSRREQVQSEKAGHFFKVKQDPRITPFGRILRRYSLDELPQLFNVLRGDMSIIGPRPLPAEDLDPDGLSAEFRVWAEERSKVRPGITGLWQISGRSDLDFRQTTELDLRYVKNWSLALDCKILARTPAVVIFGRGAY